jgi:excisionase family DNA binding protein
MRGVSRQAIARLLKKGRFKALEVGGRLLVSRSDVEQYKPERPGRPTNG